MGSRVRVCACMHARTRQISTCIGLKVLRCKVYYLAYFSYLLVINNKQWRSKVPKSGGGTQTRDLCTFGKEPI